MELQMVKLENQKFEYGNGYYMPTGSWCFKTEKGYLAFPGEPRPYTPKGGKKALQSILDNGGMGDLYQYNYLRPMEETDEKN